MTISAWCVHSSSTNALIRFLNRLWAKLDGTNKRWRQIWLQNLVECILLTCCSLMKTLSIHLYWCIKLHKQIAMQVHIRSDLSYFVVTLQDASSLSIMCRFKNVKCKYTNTCKWHMSEGNTCICDRYIYMYVFMSNDSKCKKLRW